MKLIEKQSGDIPTSSPPIKVLVAGVSRPDEAPESDVLTAA